MGVTLPWPGLSEGRGRYVRAHAGRGRPLAIDTAHTSIQHIGPMGGLHGRGDVGVVAYPATTRILGPWAFRARECRYSHPGPGRAAHSRALARIWDCMRIYVPRTPY